MKRSAAFCAILAAFLFAAGIPCAKTLLQQMHPIMLAGFLYLGSGLGLSCILFVQHCLFGKPKSDSIFSKKNRGWFIGATTLGGIIAPLLLLFAVSISKASTVSLLLNFEVVFTALIAWAIFKEHLTRRVLLSLGAILLGGICLSWTTNLAGPSSLLLAVSACACWAIDSNLMGQISHSEPMHIARCKGLIAASVNLCLALVLGFQLPALSTLGGAMLTGLVAYGVSLSLFITAMRQLGAARAMAFFSTEPFMGAVLCVIFLHDPITSTMLVAGVLMSIGVWLHLAEEHQEDFPESVPAVISEAVTTADTADAPLASGRTHRR